MTGMLFSLAPTARHVVEASYVGTTAGASYQITGNGVAVALTTGAAIVSLVILIRNGNRKTRREVADDMDREYHRGRTERETELQPWLQYWQGLATGQFPHLQPPPPIPTPVPRVEDDDE